MSTNQVSVWDLEYVKDKNKWHKESISLPKLIENKNVLELGVGNGKTLISILNQKPKSISAIDFSKEAIEISKNNFKNKKLKLLIADAKHLPFKNKEFDIVVCYYLLNNSLEKDRISIVKEIY